MIIATHNYDNVEYSNETDTDNNDNHANNDNNDADNHDDNDIYDNIDNNNNTDTDDTSANSDTMILKLMILMMIMITDTMANLSDAGSLASGVDAKGNVQGCQTWTPVCARSDQVVATKCSWCPTLPYQISPVAFGRLARRPNITAPCKAS